MYMTQVDFRMEREGPVREYLVWRNQTVFRDQLQKGMKRDDTVLDALYLLSTRVQGRHSRHPH